MLGSIFDPKQLYSELPKILNEYRKRLDTELPFFYWTGLKTRYKDYELPSFNESFAQGVVERLDKVHLSRRGGSWCLCRKQGVTFLKRAASQSKVSSCSSCITAIAAASLTSTLLV